VVPAGERPPGGRIRLLSGKLLAIGSEEGFLLGKFGIVERLVGW
jgi:hypothetical protein